MLLRALTMAGPRRARSERSERSERERELREEERVLLQQYGGVEARGAEAAEAEAARGAVGAARARRRGVRYFGAGLPRAVDSNVMTRCAAGELEQDWDLTPAYGSVTPQRALGQGARVAAAFAHREAELRAGDASIPWPAGAAAGEQKEDQGRGEQPVRIAQHQPTHARGRASPPQSAAVEFIVAALMQAKTISRERRRDQEARLRDCVHLYSSAVLRAKNLLLRESDALRRRAAEPCETHESRAVLLQDAVLRGNLAGELAKVIGEASALKGDLLLAKRAYRTHLSALMHDFIIS